MTVSRTAGDVTLEVEGDVETGPPDRNLAVRAARAILEATRQPTGVHVRLVKRIPAQAGLGGGSSDAAVTLLAVNELLGNPVPLHELFQLASRLGADVPFLLSGASLALGWGHGDRLFRLPPLPRAPVLGEVPTVGGSTGDAYGWVDAARIPSRGALALDLEAVASWGSLARMAGNDFESAVFGRVPEIRAAFEALARTHPLLCRMSGSGSALFAVFRTPRERDDAASMLGRKLGRVLPTETA